MKRSLPFVLIIAVLAAGVGLYYYLQGSAQSGPRKVTTPVANKPAASPVPEVAGAEPAHFRGPAQATVIMEEFADFQCSACGGVYPNFKAVESEYGNRLKVIFREFPLTPNHAHALVAARAAEAAGLQGKFWEMHDMLYENQKAWSDAFDVRPMFEDYAKKIGLDVERFKKDQDGDAVENRILEDGKRGHSLGVTGTPTVFLNGVELPWEQVRDVDNLRAAVKRALSDAGR